MKTKAEEWLRSDALSDEEKEQIKTLNEQELNEAFYKDLEFGTGGLRGIMGIGSHRINKYTVGMATQGFANYLKQTHHSEFSIAIAYDSRHNSKALAEVVANVFSGNNIRVYLFENLRPTPELSFAIRYLKCAGGVVLTASHNPKEYNGYKAYWSDGAQLISPHDEHVIDEVNKIASPDEVHFHAKKELITLIGEHVDKAYLNMLKSLSRSPETIADRRNLKVVYSSLHGTGITLVPKALAAFGFTHVHVVESQSEPDGNFPTVSYPNPEEKEAMSLAMKKAESLNADVVMATDPDADRVGVAVQDRQGQFQVLNGNQIGALLIYYLLHKAKEKGLNGNEFIAKTIVTSELIKEIADDFGVNSYDTLTGFKYIAALIRKLEGKERFIGGGEESYGYLIGDQVRDKDAVASCAIIAEMTAWLKNQGKSLFELLIEINRKYGLYYESLKSITKKGMKGAEEIKAMMHHYRTTPPPTLAGSPIIEIRDYLTGKSKNFNTGVIKKINLPESNVLQYLTFDRAKVTIRPSGTEPKIKFYSSVKTSLGNRDYDYMLINLQKKTNNLLVDMGL